MKNMRKIVIYTLLILMITTILPDDKVMHALAGYGLQAFFRYHDYTTEEAYTLTIFTLMLKEGVDIAKGESLSESFLDILADLFGAWCWKISEGINLKLLIK